MADEVYFVKNVATGLYLRSNDGPVFTYEHLDDSPQKWIRRELGNNQFALENVVTGYRLDRQRGGEVSTSPEDNDKAAQGWVFERGTNGFVVRNVRSREVLDGSAERRVHTRPQNNGKSQDWELTETQAPAGYTADSFRQAVRTLFETSLAVNRPRFRILGTYREVDLVVDDGIRRKKVYVKTTTKRFDDYRRFRDEFDEFFELTGRDAQGYRTIVTSKEFSREVAGDLYRINAEALSYKELERDLLFFNKRKTSQ